MKPKLILLLVLLTTLETKAQDPSFSQFNSVPLYYNPAFAGSVEKSRLAASYRNQWRSEYQTYYFSYDQAIKKLHGGIGLIAYNDNAGKNINVFYTGLAYALKFNVFNKISISPAVKIGYRRETIDASKLIWGNQYNPVTGQYDPSIPSGESIVPTSNSFDISSGLMINTEKFYAGFAVDHINQPNVGVLEGGISSLPVKYVGQLGYTFKIVTGKGDLILTPNLLYQKQYISSQLQANISVRVNHIVYCAGIRNDNVFASMMGYSNEKLIVGISYDVYVGDLSSISGYSTKGGAKEISIRYLFDLKKEKGRKINGSGVKLQICGKKGCTFIY